MRRPLVMLAFLLAGCPSSTPDDAGVDVVAVVDRTAPDSSTPDSSATDGSVLPDTVIEDGSVPDSSVISTDGGDAEAIDAGADASDAAVMSDAARESGSSDSAVPPWGVFREDASAYAPDRVSVPPLPMLDAGGLPMNDAGQFLLGANGHSELVLVRPASPSPLNALARCAVLVTHCAEARGGRTVDSCFASVRRCATSTPWSEEPCCPTDCATRYAAARTSGLGMVRSFDRALFSTPSCVPGVDAQRRGM
ncbi:MAG: hypothetical protein Q8Q09_08570 [Deltaproteobacteria bacterium]|nr:hypothetical protein [Deltaproteobacteria bacterium]